MDDESVTSPLPPQLHCRLSVKAGEPLTPCRDRLPGHDFAFMVADGYSVLLGHIKRIFDSTNGLTWSEATAVYAKPTNNAPQKKYVQLASDPEEVMNQLQAIWHKARLRKHGHASFMLLLFVYVPRRRTQRLTSLRRATDSRIQEQLPRVAAYMEEHQIEGGPATTRYAAVSQARLPEDTTTTVPEKATFRQLQFIDRQAAVMESELRQQQEAAEGYRLVRARMHGVVVPLYLNVSDIRDELDLRAYSLRPPFESRVIWAQRILLKTLKTWIIRLQKVTSNLFANAKELEYMATFKTSSGASRKLSWRDAQANASTGRTRLRSDSGQESREAGRIVELP